MNQAYYQAIVNKAIRVMEADLANPPSLELIADEAALSAFHFHRIFKSVTGQTPKNYQQHIKWSKSKELLRKSGYSIVDISDLMGYSNPESFARAFKIQFGISPQEFRNGTDVHSTIPDQADIYTELEAKLWKLYSNYKPEIIDLQELYYISYRHQGSYKSVGLSWLKLRMFALSKGYFSHQNRTFGIIHDDPYLTESSHTRYDACIQTDALTTGNKWFSTGKIAAGRYAVYTYAGPYEHFFALYNVIFRHFIEKMDLRIDTRPTLEFYKQGPPRFKPEEYITNLMIPVAN